MAVDTVSMAEIVTDLQLRLSKLTEGEKGTRWTIFYHCFYLYSSPIFTTALVLHIKLVMSKTIQCEP
jgi:hypothetical protein